MNVKAGQMVSFFWFIFIQFWSRFGGDWWLKMIKFLTNVDEDMPRPYICLHQWSGAILLLQNFTQSLYVSNSMVIVDSMVALWSFNYVNEKRRRWADIFRCPRWNITSLLLFDWHGQMCASIKRRHLRIESFEKVHYKSRAIKIF